MSALALQAVPVTTPFVRRTALQDDEYRVNFKQLDNDVIAALVSPAARAVTPLMSAIYLGLLAAPLACWEREGVLRFTGETTQHERLTAWQQLRQLTGVANSTLAKALQWLHEQSLIGYVAHKNGVGIRIFLNRAAASIRSRTTQKNLRLVPAPSSAAAAPLVGTAFKERELRENRENTSAHAREADFASEPPSQPPALTIVRPSAHELPKPAPVEFAAPALLAALTNRVVEELKPAINAATKHESEATREWFIKHALPKATRVAQRETYELLRAQGVLAKKAAQPADIGRHHAAPEQGTSLPNPANALEQWVTEFQRLATAESSSTQAPSAQVKDACQRVSTQLGELLRDTCARAAPFEVLALDQTLQQMDETLTAALWEALPATDRRALEQAARQALHAYAQRMEPTDYEELVRRRIALDLRERDGIPRLGLFYS